MNRPDLYPSLKLEFMIRESHGLKNRDDEGRRREKKSDSVTDHNNDTINFYVRTSILQYNRERRREN